MKLNENWSKLVNHYKQEHRHPLNQACHSVGIPLIIVSIPLMGSIVGFPVGAPLFVVGWAFQFLGHYFEGNKPVFTSDLRGLIAGALWWMEKMLGVRLELTESHLST